MTADALAAVTSGDNTNILCARIARDHYDIKNVVARIYDPARADIYMKLGIPTVATSSWTVAQVKRWMLPTDDSIEWSDISDTLHLVERIVPDALAGKPVANFQRRRQRATRRHRASRAGSRQHRRTLRPRGRHTRVPRDIRWAQSVARSARGHAMKVVIAGGGSVGTSIALDLIDRHHDVSLMEQS